MTLSHPGELAAMATAVLWAGSAVSFESAGRRIGSLPVNLIRLALASVFLALWGLIVHGRPLPLDAPPEAVGWLAASAVAGFVIGDLCLFQALVLIGTRLSMLVMALAPPIAAMIGWAALGESLSALQAGGMAVTLAGVAWAVLEVRPGSAVPRRDRVRGVALGLLGAVGQASGLVLSKFGMELWDDPFGAAQVRAIVGVAGFSVVFAFVGWGRVGRALRDARGLAWTAVGSVFGPFLGVAMSLLAVRLTHVGVASTIMATTPVLVIPVVVLLGRERVSPRAVGAAVLAVAGVAMLFL